MFKVIAKRKSDGWEVGFAQKKTAAEAQEFIDEAVENENWGKPQREVTADMEDVSGAISQRDEVLADGTTRTLYTLPAEYTVEVIDITAEVTAAKAKEDEIKLLKEQIRTTTTTGADSVTELRTLVFAMAKILGLRD